MEFLDRLLLENSEYSALLNDVKKGYLPTGTAGLSLIHKAAVISALAAHTGKKIFVITPDEAAMNELYADLSAMGKRTFTFPLRDMCFTDMLGRSAEYEHKRLNTLSAITDGDFDVVIASSAAAAQYTMPKSVLKSNSFVLKTGNETAISSLTEKLIDAGYSKQLQVEGTGQFSVRGGIVDIYAANFANPVRIEFFGDEIDTLTEFDIVTQRRTQPIDEIKIIPAAEVVFRSEELCTELESYAARAALAVPAQQRIESDISLLKSGVGIPTDRYITAVYKKNTLFDYIDDNAFIAVSDSTAAYENLKGYISRINEDIKCFLEDGYVFKKYAQFNISASEYRSYTEKSVYLENFAVSKYDVPLKDMISFNFKRISAWHGDINVLIQDIQGYDKNARIIILSGKEKAARVLCDALNSHGVKAALYTDAPPTVSVGVSVCCGGLSAGMELPEQNAAVFTQSYVYSEKRTHKRVKSENVFSSLDELKEGDYVVHATHGIGIFSGIRKITSGGITKDYIRITYAKGDALYVPVTQLDLISKYIGNTENSTVKVNKLGSSDWQKTRTRVKKAVKDMAKQLTQLYAKRMSVKGYAFEPDTQLQKEFEATFPYVETEDQLRCIKEIKSDMQRDVPMDRLLCGDVGFGKTEVALRAAFKCISEGKQCALLVPTTILAWQHYNTALRRFGDMPLNVKMLSRFVTPGAQRKIIADTAAGKVDMVIGTHRIISKDVKFKSLGLVIIDEEQRFGVAQKERLKEEYPNVDVLTLSATPIPRTLNMAMSGLRDMSTIEQSPGDRLPVQSYVLEYNEAVVYDAIRRELRRSGQVYFLHNRVEDIVQCASKIKSAIPEVRIAVAHGKMAEEELSDVWQKLIEHEIDVLVCTTIIETGVDVSNANTLIIEQADRMGLSQLHQLRGRVGRSPRRAYAYFCFKRDKQLSEVAEKRLEAIREFTEFGAGFKIAMRDLEIRGAGNILGGEQHGNMEAVGYDMYIKLLNEAINEEKGIVNETENECTVDLGISAYIPERYINSLPARLGVYKRIAAVSDEEGKQDVTDELIDRFGDPPQAVMGLINIALLRNKAAKLGICEISEDKSGLILRVGNMTQKQITVLGDAFGKRFCVFSDEKPYYTVKYAKGQNKADLVKELSQIKL